MVHSGEEAAAAAAAAAVTPWVQIILNELSILIFIKYFFIFRRYR